MGQIKNYVRNYSSSPFIEDSIYVALFACLFIYAFICVSSLLFVYSLKIDFVVA